MSDLLRILGCLALFCCTPTIGFGQSWQVFDMNNSDLPSNTVHAITNDLNGNLWVGTDWGLARFDGSDWEIFQMSNSPIPENNIRALAIDGIGRLWIGTFQNGLIIKDGSDWVQYNTNNSPMPANQVRSITLEDDGDAWICTVDGLAWFDGAEWRIYIDQDTSYNALELPVSNIPDVAVRNDGLVCIATLNGGFTYLTDSTVSIFTIANSNLADNTAYAVAIDQNGERWAAAPFGGLLFHNGPFTGGGWLQYNTLSSGIPTDALNDIVIDEQDTKIIATQTAGVTFFSGLSNWVTLNETNSDLPDNVVLTLHLDENQALWVGTETGGLARYDHITGINDNSTSEIVNIYPTLGNGILHVDIANPQIVNYSVYDLSGKAVSNGQVFQEKNVLNFLQLPSGTYLIQFELKRSARTLIFTKL